MLKIITGVAKGKVLKTREGEATRPTSSRVKEALFSSIQFDIENRRVLDLFAGSGGLGLEALSRGASGCTFIDASREAIETVKENARITGFFGVSKYLVSDYRNYIRKASGRDVFDLVFIDADKKEYCDYLDLVLPLMRKGGWILADNTLWDGHIIESAYDKDKQTIALRAFNDKVAQDERLEKVILPLRDGLTIIRVKELVN